MTGVLSVGATGKVLFTSQNIYPLTKFSGAKDKIAYNGEYVEFTRTDNGVVMQKVVTDRYVPEKLHMQK